MNLICGSAFSRTADSFPQKSESQSSKLGRTVSVVLGSSLAWGLCGLSGAMFSQATNNFLQIPFNLKELQAENIERANKIIEQSIKNGSKEFISISGILPHWSSLLDTARVGTEFALASQLSWLAMRTLGCKPSKIASLVTGFVATAAFEKIVFSTHPEYIGRQAVAAPLVTMAAPLVTMTVIGAGIFFASISLSVIVNKKNNKDEDKTKGMSLS